MKSQRTNAFQLAIAGAVLVLVIVCGTFAWFAVGNFSSLKNILSTVIAPEIPNQLNYVEYSLTGGADADDWQKYSGEAIDIEPGKELHFRATFTAGTGAYVQVNLINLSNAYREPVVEESTAEQVQPLADEGDSSATTADLRNMLEYKTILKDSSTDYQSLSNVLSADKSSAVILPRTFSGAFIKNVSQYVFYYDIKMSEDAGNEYMNAKLSFDIQLAFQKGLEDSN